MMTTIMKKAALAATAIFCSISAFAQKGLEVQGTYPAMYITHTVAPKQTFYGISKMYNQALPQLYKFNGMAEGSGLSVGAVLKIPLDKNNFTQDGQKAAGQVLIAVYHTVGAGETLYRISQNYGKLRMDFIREWNNLNKDVIHQGQQIVIGHLIVPQARSAEVLEAATAIQSPTRTGGDETETTTAPVKETRPSYSEPETPVTPPATPPVTTQAPPPATKPVNSNPPVTNTTKPAANVPEPDYSKISDEGFFKTQFKEESRNKDEVSLNADAATFKTASGWTNKKYYVLMNDVEPGTIVKVSSANDAVIYAKVLGPLPATKDAGIVLRISNAAASILRIADEKFNVTVTYYK
jgi:LysM repeat protein